MTRTTSPLLRSLLAALVAAASLVVLAGTAAPAGAGTTDGGTTYLIAWGNDENVIEDASATVTRITEGDHDVITVSFTVPGGFDESHLCVSENEAFTERHPPGQCAHKIESRRGSTLTTGEYAFQVSTGTTVHLQLHIVVGNETAYAAWTPGGPFHGNIEVPALPVPETPTPVACPAGEMAPEGQELVDADGDGFAENCVVEPVEAPCPDDEQAIDGETPMDTDGDGVADTGCEAPEVVVPVTCPDGSAMIDRNDDGVIDDRDCVVTVVLPAPEVIVPSLPVLTPELPALPDAPGTPDAPFTPEVPAGPQVPAAPATTVDVLPAAEVVPTVVTVDNPQVTAVLGDQVVAGSLPRTGAATPGLAAFGALLLAAGTVLTRMGRATT